MCTLGLFRLPFSSVVGIPERKAWLELPGVDCKGTAQVLDVVAESVGCFDEVNVATALHRLAKLQPPNSGGQASPVIYADHFQQLVVAIKRQLHRFEAQAVSNTLWGKLRVASQQDTLLACPGLATRAFNVLVGPNVSGSLQSVR